MPAEWSGSERVSHGCVQSDAIASGLLIEQQSEFCTMRGREDEPMKRAKLLAVAVAIAFASVTFASEASAGVTGIIIYLGQNPYVYCPHPSYSYGYYTRYAYGYVPYRRGHWGRHPLK